MKRWITTSVLGTGKPKDPRRPDLKGKKADYVVAADNGTEMLVLLVKPGGVGIVGGAGVKHHGDETFDGEQNRWKRSEQLEVTLKDEAKRLGAGDDWHPRGYGVGG